MDTVETVTILFTDLVGSTELASRVGPEQAELLRQEHFGSLREAIAAGSGREVKNLGDGLMVSFSSAAAAMECATSMQQRVEVRNRRAEETLEVRIGVSMGDATRDDGDYFGPPVVEAARLCAKATTGQVLLPEVTRVMVGRRGDHVFRSVGDLELKGIPEPTATCELVWEPLPAVTMPLPDRLQALPETTYVGREKQRARLAELWRLAGLSQRHVALLAGEGGIGKTRLATCSALEAQASGGTVLYGHCDEEVGGAYQPWVEALQRLVEHCDLDTLRAHVAEHGGELRRLVPSVVVRVPGCAEPRTSDPETERYMLFRAVAELLSATSATESVLLFLDDLHWADTASLALLRHVVSNVVNARLLILCTYRDSDLSAGHALSSTLAGLRREQRIEWLDLSGLDPREVAALIEAAAGHDLDTAGMELADAVSKETDGNPFFVTEMLRHLLESGGVVQGSDGRYTITADVKTLGLPRGVRDVLGQRVQRLGETASEVLRAAAVIGRQFDTSLLTRAVDLDEDVVLDSLESAVAAALLRESTEVPGRFVFVHALVNRTLYEDLSRTRRARLHRRVAEALEELSGPDSRERLNELASHWAEATTSVDATKAATYARRAGEEELRQLAPVEALRWFTQALEQLASLAGDHASERCELLILVGEAQRQTGDPSYRITLADAGQLAARLGDADRMARAAIANHGGLGFTSAGAVDRERANALELAIAAQPVGSPHRAMLLAQLAAELTYEADFEGRVRPIVDEALALARRDGDQKTRSHVLAMASAAIYPRPDLVRERQDLASELMGLVVELRDPYLLFMAHLWCYTTAIEVHDIDALHAAVASMGTVAAETGQPWMVWMSKVFSAVEAHLDGQLGRMEELAAEVLALGTELSEPHAFSYYGAQLGAVRHEQDRLTEIIDLYVDVAANNPGIPSFDALVTRYLVELGRLSEAVPRIEAAARAGFPLPFDSLFLYGSARWAEAVVAGGDRSMAGLLYDRLLPFRSHLINSGVTAIGSAEMFLGHLAGQLERFDDSEAHFAAAASVHEAIAAPLCLARTWLYWAGMRIKRGSATDGAEARTLLIRASELARAHGSVAIQRHCAELLGQIDI